MSHKGVAIVATMLCTLLELVASGMDTDTVLATPQSRFMVYLCRRAAVLAAGFAAGVTFAWRFIP